MEPNATEPNNSQPSEPTTPYQPGTPDQASTSIPVNVTPPATTTPPAGDAISPSTPAPQPAVSSVVSPTTPSEPAPETPSIVVGDVAPELGGQPIATVDPYKPTPVKSKRKLIIGAASAVVVVGGALAFYFGYLTSPSHVYSAALSNTGKGYDKLVEYSNKVADAKYKGYTGSGSYKVSSSGTTIEGKLAAQNDGENSDSTFDVNSSDIKLNFDFRTIKSASGGTTPDIYFKAGGLDTLKSFTEGTPYTALINKYNNAWISVDHSLIDAIDKSSGSGDAKPPTREQINDEAAAIGKVNRDYVFTTKKDKAITKVVKTYGKETVDGHKTYHYQIAFVPENVKAYLKAQQEALKNSKLEGWIKSNNYEDSVNSAFEDAIKSTTDIKTTDTLDVWADINKQLLYKVRLVDDPKKPDAGYADIGLDYTGGSVYPFFVKYHSKDGSSTSDASFVMSLDSKTDIITMKADGKSSGDDSFNFNADFTLKPTNTAPKVSAPSTTIPLTTLLHDLGLDDYVQELQAYSASSSSSSSSTQSGVNTKAKDTKRQVDVQALQTQLEAYYAEHGWYPSLADMNSSSWLKTNMKSLDTTALQDPDGSSQKLVGSPAAKVYSYAVADSSGKSCESDEKNCATYALTATLSDGTHYTKNNLD